MMRYNDGVLQALAARGEPISTGFGRGWGQTTQAILRAFANSYDSPGTVALVEDKGPTTRAAAHNLWRTACEMRDALGLSGLVINIDNFGRVTVRNDFTKAVA